jgi:hypothetical protein
VDSNPNQPRVNPYDAIAHHLLCTLVTHIQEYDRHNSQTTTQPQFPPPLTPTELRMYEHMFVYIRALAQSYGIDTHAYDAAFDTHIELVVKGDPLAKKDWIERILHDATLESTLHG